MAFTLPEFNLTCDIYSGPYLTKAFRISVDGNLAFGRRVNWVPHDIGAIVEDLAVSWEMFLLLPPLTDVRSTISSGQGDVIEAPAGSGRWYGVAAVEDIGKGFDNEHRVAALYQISEYRNAVAYAGLFWPVPMP